MILRLNKKLVKGPHLHTGDKQLVNSQRLQVLHLMAFLVPPVKLSDHMHPMGMRRPDCKMNALLSLMLDGMRSQLSENIIVISLSEQILIHICHKAGGQLRLLLSSRLCFLFLFLCLSHNAHSCNILNTALPPADISN